jgi:hypothetical protein
LRLCEGVASRRLNPTRPPTLQTVELLWEAGVWMRSGREPIETPNSGAWGMMRIGLTMLQQAPALDEQ